MRDRSGIAGVLSRPLSISRAALIASACVLSVGASTALAAPAKRDGARAASHRAAHAAAKAVNLNESGSLKRVGKPHGLNLYEKGTASGTINGSIYIQLNVKSTRSVTAKVSVYPHGGSITGYGSASYSVHGAYAHFAGKLSITQGSGSWKGAHGKNLKFSGTIKRSNDAVTVSLSGKLYR